MYGLSTVHSPPDGFPCNLRELVTSTTVILAPGACGRGVRKRSSCTHFRGIRGIAGIRLRVVGGSILCAGATLLAGFPVKDLPFFMIFKGRPREEAQGTPRRPKESQGAPKGVKRSPRGAQGEPKGAPNGAKMSKQGRKLY